MLKPYLEKNDVKIVVILKTILSIIYVLFDWISSNTILDVEIGFVQSLPSSLSPFTHGNVIFLTIKFETLTFY